LFFNLHRSLVTLRYVTWLEVLWSSCCFYHSLLILSSVSQVSCYILLMICVWNKEVCTYRLVWCSYSSTFPYFSNW
jgi:hypothetical protein